MIIIHRHMTQDRKREGNSDMMIFIIIAREVKIRNLRNSNMRILT
jgi:hypothetical protein